MDSMDKYNEMMRKLGFILFGSILGYCILSKFDIHTNTARALDISYNFTSFSNITMQVEPYYTNDIWWTNLYGTNMIISQSTYNTALIGPTIKLTWDNANNTVLTWSTNLVDWNDIKIRWLGQTGVWYSYPQDKRFFKLRAAETQ